MGSYNTGMETQDQIAVPHRVHNIEIPPVALGTAALLLIGAIVTRHLLA